VFGGFLLLGGRAGDLIGRKRLFLAGVALFTFASLLDGVSQSGGMLIAARALQGLGAALVSPAALSIITTTFADGPERTKALGVWGGIAAGGGAVGLLLGGVLTQALSWQWIFFVNIPIGIAAFLLSARYVPESRAEKRPAGVDVAGAVSVTAGLSLLVYAIVKAQDYGWGSSTTLGLIAGAVALLAAFVAIERRSKAPLIRLGVFRIRSLASANGVMLLVASGMFAFFFFSSLYVQEILGFSPIEAGLAFLPFTAGIMAGAGAAQQLIRRFGVRPVAVAGMLLAAGGLALMTRAGANGSYASDLLPGIIPMSIGMGLTFVPITLIGTTNVDNADAGLASGVFNTSQQVGGALGLAVLSTFATNRTADVAATGASKAQAMVDGFHVAFTAGAGLIALGAIVLAVLIRPRDVATINADQPALAAA
jgi:EmrB/QacA subfamily drug resistance transporter